MIFLFILAFFSLWATLEDKGARDCALYMGMFALLEATISRFSGLPIESLCIVAICLDGLAGAIVLSSSYRYKTYIASLYSLAITFTFLLGILEVFYSYRDLINTIIVFQIVSLLLGGINGKRRLLDTRSNLRGGK